MRTMLYSSTGPGRFGVSRLRLPSQWTRVPAPSVG